MLVKIKGIWINPDNIAFLQVMKQRKETEAYRLERNSLAALPEAEPVWEEIGTNVIFNSYAGGRDAGEYMFQALDLQLPDLTPDQVADLIKAGGEK